MINKSALIKLAAIITLAILTGCSKNQQLLNAIKSKDSVTVQQLIHKGANVNIKNHLDTTPLIFSIVANSPEVAQELIKAGADINARSNNGGYTPLMCAAFLGHEDLVKSLLAMGANINSVDDINDTAIIWALLGNNGRIADILLDAGANRNDITKYDNTYKEYSLTRLGKLTRMVAFLDAAGFQKKQ